MQSLSILSANGLPNLILHGLGAAPVLRGCTRRPATEANEAGWVLEEYRLVMEGSPQELDEVLRGLEDRLGRAAHGETLHLQMVPYHGCRPWGSPLLGGEIAFLDEGSSSRGRGAQVLLLRLRRGDFWQAEQHEAPLSNAYGHAVTGGLPLDNHSDGGSHTAFVTVEDGALVGDLPAPARLELFNDVGSPTSALQEIFLGCYLDANSPPPDLTLQGESATPAPDVSSSLVSDVGSANGLFRRCTWLTGGEQVLLNWPLPPGLLSALNNRPVLPLLRLATPGAENDHWASWRVCFGEQTLFSSELGLLLPNRALQVLPGLRLPPAILPGETPPAGLTLQLVLTRLSSTARQLDVDFVTLLPLDGWRSLRPLAHSQGGLPPGAIWMDDPTRHLSWSVDPAQGELITHACLGEPLVVWPGHRQRIYLLHGGIEMDIHHTTRLRLLYWPRRRAL